MSNEKRYHAVSDLPEWTVHDDEAIRDLFPTKSGNRNNACRQCSADTAKLIADALNWHELQPLVKEFLEIDDLICHSEITDDIDTERMNEIKKELLANLT